MRAARPGSHAPARPLTRSQVADLVQRFYFQLWNRWDDTAVESVLAPDLLFRGSLGETLVGLDAWRGYRDRVRAASPDFHTEIVELVVDGDRASARLRWSGTHVGQLLGMEPTGRRFTYEGAAFLRAGPAGLVEIWVIADLLALQRSLRDRDPSDD